MTLLNRRPALLAKGNLTGRIVGYSVISGDEGREMTRWARVVDWTPGCWAGLTYHAVNRHTGERCFIRPGRIHTVMPSSY